ncbi:hypothetical protein DFP74_1833 [Nocardiopsis sp. Huas11]|uniref:hypothetical protein n=1 Tax=Nocardiopsis sp. Huas11 TaxID=2183912 RepID=UPI000EAB6546|nr:hypothetical protein [Nocardiopsis sp. Huas11]RKS06209.1 hypothetical protein DFP74_1833 [Nocardiopsis sp. Huas11]
MKDPDKVGLRGVIKALRESNDTQKEGRLSTSSLGATDAGAAFRRSRASRRGGDAGSFMADAAKQQKEDRRKGGLLAHARRSQESLKKKPPTA